MNKVLEKLEAYGVDLTETLDRFVEDEELYLSCLESFKEEEAFSQLRSCLDEGDYEFAFDAAHTLKGVSGNLGLTPLFEVVCEMVETLRNRTNEDLEGKYARIMEQKAKIDKILEDL